MATNIEDSVQRQTSKTSSSSFSSNLTGSIRSRDKWEGGWLVFDDVNDQENEGRLCLSDSCGGWRGLVSFEN